MGEPRFTADMDAAIRDLNKEIRSLRAKLTSATYRAETAAERAEKAEAMLAESRRQVEMLLDSRRHLEAVCTVHADGLRDLWHDLRADGETSSAPAVIQAGSPEEAALIALLAAVGVDNG